MKNTPFFLIILLLIFSSFELQATARSSNVIVAGKILNYDPEIPLSLTLNGVGLMQEETDIDIDKEGNFHAEFEVYSSLDAWVRYRTNFLIQLNPNDSLYLVFDGNAKQRPELLSTIEFAGNDAITNGFIAKFQQLYYSNDIYTDWDKKNKAKKEYEPDQYVEYNDSVMHKAGLIYEEFVRRFTPNEKSKNWARFFGQDDYYSNIAFYADDHRSANKMGWDNAWTVPKGFYEKMTARLPLDASSLASSYSLNSYADQFLKYVMEKLAANRKEDDTWHVLPGGGLMAPSESYDSLTINAIVNYVPDTLLKEIMLTNFFTKQFAKQDIRSYETHGDLVDTHIRQDFLKEPLEQSYLQTKQRIEKPELYTAALLREADQSTAKDIVNDILEINKGKVVYIDFWATWCGPCLGEMPNSKQAEKDLDGQDVSFVYICIQSEKEKYLATIAEYQLGGQHYFLSAEQSRDILKLFEIRGIPFYAIINKDGVVVDKGNHLRPLDAKKKIEELL